MFYMINFSPGDVEFAFILDDGDEAKRAEAGRQVEDEEVVVIHQLTLDIYALVFTRQIVSNQTITL